MTEILNFLKFKTFVCDLCTGISAKLFTHNEIEYKGKPQQINVVSSSTHVCTNAGMKFRSMSFELMYTQIRFPTERFMKIVKLVFLEANLMKPQKMTCTRKFWNSQPIKFLLSAIKTGCLSFDKNENSKLVDWHLDREMQPAVFEKKYY